MAAALDFPVSFNSVMAPWIEAPELRAVSSGAPYGMRCVAAIGPADFSSVLLVVTANPRQRAGRAARETGKPMVVHHAVWSQERAADAVFAQLRDLVARADLPLVNGWTRFPRAFLDPLLLQSAEKVGVEAMLHSQFHAHALGIETEKLRARLAKGGIDPKVVAAHRYVSAAEAPPSNRADWILPLEKVKTVRPSFARTRQMTQLYKAGCTLRHIATKFGVNHVRVRQILVEAGVELRKKGRVATSRGEKAFV